MAGKRKRASFKKNLLLIAGLLMGIVFLPTSVVLFIGMLPTMACSLMDRSKGRMRTLSIGAMNLAGCTPFVLELWMKGHTMENAVAYITQPRTIIVMYFAAAIGYVIEWGMAGIIASMVGQRAKGRLREIEKEQKKLVERWGPEVSGHIQLDEEGFPVENAVADESPALPRK